MFRRALVHEERLADRLLPSGVEQSFVRSHVFVALAVRPIG